MTSALSIGYNPAKGVTREIVVRHGMTVEVSHQFRKEAAEEVPQLASSIHLPWNDSDIGRINYAAKDPEFRGVCLQRIKDAVVFGSENFPALRLAVVHGAPERWAPHPQDGGREGDYGAFIAGIRELADFAGTHGMLLVLENNNCYWVNAEGKTAWQDAHPASDMVYFGCGPDQWLQTFHDADHDNLRLCLDTAHACTWAHTIPDRADRIAGLLSYFREPAAIAHVHWNGHHAFEPEGRVDGHLNVGTGTIPEEMHRRVRDLDATHLIEHYHGETELLRELAFIRGL